MTSYCLMEEFLHSILYSMIPPVQILLRGSKHNHYFACVPAHLIGWLILFSQDGKFKFCGHDKHLSTLYCNWFYNDLWSIICSVIWHVSTMNTLYMYMFKFTQLWSFVWYALILKRDASVKHTLGCLWYVLQKIRRHWIVWYWNTAFQSLKNNK